MAEVAFEGVSKVYGDGTRAVDGLDLEIAPADLVRLTSATTGPIGRPDTR